MENILIVAILMAVFYFIGKKLFIDGVGDSSKSSKKFFSIDDEYNAKKILQKRQIDRILEKISKHGIESLTPKERALLDEHSKKQ